MPKQVTVTFSDGTSHTYQGVPDTATPDEVEARAQKDFNKQVKALAKVGPKGADKALADARQRSKNTSGAVRAVNQGFTFNLSDEIDAAGAAVETGARNLASKTGLVKGAGYSPKEAYQAVMQSEKEAGQQYAKQAPVANFAANVVGGIANPLAKAGGGFVAGGKGLAQVAGRSAIVGGATGAAYGAGEGQGMERVQNALVGGGTGAAIGGAIPVAGKVAGKAINALGATKAAKQAAARKEEVRALQREGVDLTYGEMFGGPAKMLEDVTSTVSGAIGGARERGREQLNKAAINRALAPIGEKLSKNTEAGREAIDEMIVKTGRAMEDAYSGAKFIATPTFGQSLKQVADDTLVGVDMQTRQRAKSLTDSLLKGPLVRNGQIEGKDLGRAMSRISAAKRAALSGPTPDKALFDYYQGLEREVIKSINRDKTGDVKKIMAARKAYALSLRPERAANAVGAEGGVFSPAQLQTAVKATAGGARKRDFARGRAGMQDLSEASKNIMAPKIGSTGSGERAAILGLAGTAFAGNPLPLVGAVATEIALRGAYSKPVLRLVNDLARAKSNSAANGALSQLRRAALNNPEAKAALTQITTRLAAEAETRKRYGERSRAPVNQLGSGS